MESSSLGQFLLTDLVAPPGSVPPSVASSEDSSNDSSVPWKADSLFHMNGGGGGSGTNSPRSPQHATLHLAELPRSIVRPSRESVLQRLSESLLRRSLTKVIIYSFIRFTVGCAFCTFSSRALVFGSSQITCAYSHFR